MGTKKKKILGVGEDLNAVFNNAYMSLIYFYVFSIVLSTVGWAIFEQGLMGFKTGVLEVVLVLALLLIYPIILTISRLSTILLITVDIISIINHILLYLFYTVLLMVSDPAKPHHLFGIWFCMILPLILVFYSLKEIVSYRKTVKRFEKSLNLYLPSYDIQLTQNSGLESYEHFVNRKLPIIQNGNDLLNELKYNYKKKLPISGIIMLSVFLTISVITMSLSSRLKETIRLQEMYEKEIMDFNLRHQDILNNSIEE